MSQKKPIYYPRSFLHVLESKCSTCIFTKNTILEGGKARLQAQLALCEKNGNYQECHHATNAGEQVCCRGFWDWCHKNDRVPAVIQIGERLRLVVEVSQADLDALAELKNRGKYGQR